MSALQQLFASSELEVVVPDTSLEYPPPVAADGWLARLRSGKAERSQAYFDEQLQPLLILRIDQPPSSTSKDPANPPKELVTFISHLQISLEATYISSVPVHSPQEDPLRTARLAAPPRTASLGPKRANHPSIFPPSTPNPTPLSAESDKRYLQSEGTLLLAGIWGQNTAENSKEAFSLLWSDEEDNWVAVYRLGLTVSFLRLAVSDPLLCLTVSSTLRDRPQTLNRPNHPLSAFLSSLESLTSNTAPSSPSTPNGVPTPGGNDSIDPILSGLPEVNLFEGLSGGPTFPPSELDLPSARLGSVSRLKLFTLQPLSPGTPLPAASPSPMTATGRSQSISISAPATMRKSFRKTLPTVSGFRVRMRTVFVPAVLFADIMDDSSDPEDPDRLEAGTDERTVMLCVELENSSGSGRTVGFEVDRVEVKVGGSDDGDAKAVLIGWSGADGQSSVFPLRVASSEQYNLLYAVSFLRSPDEALAMGLVKDGAAQQMLQRSVTIGIFGRPYLSQDMPYPTQIFCSKWNCILDLSAQPHPEPEDEFRDGDVQLQIPSVMPEPASPFPTNPRNRSDSLINMLKDSSSPGPTKRHTLPGGQALVAARAIGMKPGTGVGYRASTSMLNPSNSRIGSPPIPPPRSNSYTPPSVTLSASMPRSPTTFSADQPRLSVDPNYQPSVPMTPAYPSYPTWSAVPPTPPGVAAQSNTQGIGSGPLGRSVEIRRERGAPVGTGTLPIPVTPGPVLAVGGGGFAGLNASVSGTAIDEGPEYEVDQDAARNGEAIVVSVGLLASGSQSDADKNADLGKTAGSVVRDEINKIFPLDHFTLDIFVFNQSEWTRRFEVTCPDRRRGRARNPGEKVPSPGIVPLDNRVRIGPLLPAACQSVRMEFLAVTPGVHPIDTLTLTDVVSGYSLNLRSVMDIVVHEPDDEA
ncbi:unnamed protein product [Mycena citricolor]|uniref:Trafficking protein particle complex II-specific subunit 65 IgD3 domain-containing protein n=1 Tax=Mycena citricolor TaxID=2018698 RepID=A0AAD2HI12_9AGAR|nr:unnamed protein product [Mycena citricolor]